MKKIGAITIGQAPRTDVMEDLDDILRGDVELIQAGALDLLTLEEVETLRPDGTGNTLVSRMRDGTGVMLQEHESCRSRKFFRCYNSGSMIWRSRVSARS